MSSLPQRYFHRRLDCGAEFAAEHLPARNVVAFELRVLAGLVAEPSDKLGLAFQVEQTISKGTEKRSGQELSSALDALGALHGSWVGRETIGFRCTCLPEHLPAVIDLHAEMLRTPTFPHESCRVSIELAQQELTALEDDPGELSRKLTLRHAYGPLLGRHAYGERESLQRISRDDVVGFWRQHFAAAAMQIAVAGPIEPRHAADLFDHALAGFGTARAAPPPVSLEFAAGRWHYHKDLEQQHISICWPGVSITDPQYHVERLILSILGDGMSSRLFTEVREKQGLVYWVGAWHEHPRTGGMIHLGASSTPARCGQTYATLLREVDRLAEDLTPDELQRAKTQIIARSETHGDMTRARVGELSADLFHFGRPVPLEEKNAAVAAVGIDDIRRYLAEHPRDRQCVVTLGPQAEAS